MDKSTTPEPPSRGDMSQISFSLHQAAAICGVNAHQVWEWTLCGYVRTTGQGDNRRYNREGLKQILSIRDAVRSDNRRNAAEQSEPHGPVGSEQDTQWSDRNMEFSLPPTPMDDAHLLLQAEMYFALNAGTGTDCASLARYFSVDEEQMESVLDTMVQSRRIVRVRQGGIVQFHASRTPLHGPSVREQRIRATRRHRQPSRNLS